MEQVRAKRSLAMVCVCAGLMVGFAAPASAAKFEGKTSQGEAIRVTTNASDIAVKANYGWVMNCRGGGTITDGTRSSGFPATVRGFRSSGRYEADYPRNFSANIKVRIDGDRVSDNRFKGSFSLTAKVFKNGESVTKCKTRTVRYTADLKGPATPPEPPTAPRFVP